MNTEFVSSASESDLDKTRRELAEARAAIQARDQFLSHAAHELRTPLTALKLQTQLRQRSLSKGDMSKFSPENLGVMLGDDLRQITKLAQLVDEMLDVSRLNLGKN